MTDIAIRTDFPRKVREIENTWIPMPDGTKLAARIWLPKDAEDDPVPAILEYLPYRKRDGTVERDATTHPYFAGYGYAGVRVDMRGTGDSEGVCLGEYLLQEQDDALAVIDWLVAQPWCSGKVGMIGISWGGFNGLQVAARQPEGLGAVITLCSTDDRYTDDIHFMGGAMLTDKLAWGATAFAIANTPPDPAIVGDRWRGMWEERIAQNGLWFRDWVAHQRRDAFYAHGSICEDWEKVQVPVYAVGGYADGYTNPIFRMMEHLPGPRKALVGPWAHKYPHFATPEPRIGFLQECLRWWDQHLKGIDTGITEEPMIRAWMQGPAAPSPHAVPRPGRWISAEGWPVAGAATRALHLGPSGLSDAAEDGAGPIRIASPETAGWTAQTWCIYGVDADGALDQMGEAGLMTGFETGPLAEDLEIFGFPRLHARVTSRTAQANLAAVLSMVAPDGTARLVSFGILNLTHRESHASPEPMPAGAAVDVTVQLNVIGQTVPAGYKLRLALSSAYWPMIFPSAEKAELELDPAATWLELPLHDPAAPQPELAEFGPAEGAAPLETEVLSEGSGRRVREVDLASGVETTVRADDTGLHRHVHTGIAVRYQNSDTFRIHPGDPNSAELTCRWSKHYSRGDWSAELDATVSMQALRDVWHITARLEARDGEEVVAVREWDEKIPRDMV
ncbi:CocE/NonD family hydrolase [Ovoidimarina sediminis]|uniref:CocE/NonD family hydrolase n=1 Tax=Ovoidimarina sediminis TaxID=3079856 RepID=UPI002913A095|nr:CocE/NonD family hydrolase [Rhodophyticola sp. MJ-SS7]MDU8945755.1 CocE/NonD family hydrolase [Rhodophyticola sp. MJ-SS7]